MVSANLDHATHAKRAMLMLMFCSAWFEQANLHPRPEEVDVFLAMDEHGAGVRGRSGSRPPAWTSAKISPLDAPTNAGEEQRNPRTLMRKGTVALRNRPGWLCFRSQVLHERRFLLLGPFRDETATLGLVMLVWARVPKDMAHV